jgi:hypothetical protein
MIAHDLFEWTNAAIGSVGLAITVVAAFQAKFAKTAARQAEKSVQSHQAENDFIALARMAKELHGYVEHEQLPEAKVRVADLRAEFSASLQRHRQFLKSDWKRLSDQQISLKLAADCLNSHLDDLSAKERVRILESTGEILEVLAGQSGKLSSTAERRASYE